jgi:hypothetical protein
LIVTYDNRHQPYIEWRQAPGGFKRAWIWHAEDRDQDWAGTGRYINVARIKGFGTGPAGDPTDFPIFSNLSDEQILIAFVASVCGITGCPLP